MDLVFLVYLCQNGLKHASYHSSCEVALIGEAEKEGCYHPGLPILSYINDEYDWLLNGCLLMLTHLTTYPT